MIIFELDGTLANCEHRRHFVVNPYSIDGESPDCNCSEPNREFSCPFDDWSSWKPNWPAFYDACDKDLPIVPVRSILYDLMEKNMHIKNFEIWSGRCESVKVKTIKWLEINIDNTKNWEKRLKMRPIGDNTPDDQLKEKWLDEAIAQDKIIDFVFDGDPKSIKMYRKRGIFVFNCAQNDGEF